MTVKVGTCSWTDKSLIQSGKFYPDDVKSAEDRLRYYASVFSTVEVDSTYYGLPSRRNSELWVERTPDAFTFHIKAFRLFTGHWANLSALPADLRDEAAQHANRNNRVYARDLPNDVTGPLWDYFYTALEPLADSGRLGNVLFQFAPWVRPGRGTLKLISEAKERMSPYQLAVEFRNNLWFSGDQAEETLGFLRDNSLVYAAVDEPQGFTSSVPPIVDVTGPNAYIRFHGRNSETWDRSFGPSLDRFDWWYTEEELSEWLPRIEFLERETDTVYVLFNTNNANQAPANGQLLLNLLGD